VILAISRFRVANGRESDVVHAFVERPHLVDDAAGFLGMETFVDEADRATFYLVTRWTDRASFEEWHGSDAHHASHAWIPRGLKLDPSQTQVTVLDRLPRPRRSPALIEAVADAAPIVARYLGDASATHLIVADPDGTVRACNHAVAARMGVSPATIVGKALWDLLTDDDAAMLRELVQSGKRHLDDSVLLNFCDADHQPYTLECRVDPQPDRVLIVGEPSVRGQSSQDEMLRLNNDLAVLSREHARKSRELERAQAELAGVLEQLRAANEQLEGHVVARTTELSRTNNRLARELVERDQVADELRRSNSDLEQFAYVASHDLQEPIRMVVSYMQLLQRRYGGKLDERADEFIGFAVDGALRMQVLINDLLAYARIDRREAPEGPTDLNRVVDRVVHDQAESIDAIGAQVTRGDLPTIVANSGQMDQLLGNLIANALKFHGSEPPRVRISAERQVAGWRIAVEDNGIGIAPEYQERIFVIFQRLHGRGAYPGTGIGLALCKKIVERLGGRIGVESSPGAGATFWFTIPDRPLPPAPVGGPR
jgi:signal transduction histidine kinase/heme-degrading monooxygenase HmoA